MAGAYPGSSGLSSNLSDLVINAAALYPLRRLKQLQRSFGKQAHPAGPARCNTCKPLVGKTIALYLQDKEKGMQESTVAPGIEGSAMDTKAAAVVEGFGNSTPNANKALIAATVPPHAKRLVMEHQM